MFDFEKLEVYKIAHQQNLKLTILSSEIYFSDEYFKERFKIANLEILLFLTEGSSRIEMENKQSFYIKARGAVFNAVTILLLLKDQEKITESAFTELYNGYESLSRMLLTLIRHIGNNLGTNKPIFKKKIDNDLNIKHTFGE
ncbi:MAG: four helix bundle protein [Chitinophagaceae bacterium]